MNLGRAIGRNDGSGACGGEITPEEHAYAMAGWLMREGEMLTEKIRETQKMTFAPESMLGQQYKEAVTLMSRAMHLLKETGEADELAFALSRLGDAQRGAMDYVAAAHTYGRAVKVMEDTPKLCGLMTWARQKPTYKLERDLNEDRGQRVMCLKVVGGREALLEAKALSLKLLSYQKQKVGVYKEDDNAFRVLRNLADLSLRLEEYPMVGLYAQKALVTLETAHLPSSEALQGRLLLYDMWGSALEALGQGEQALDKARRALKMWEAQPAYAHGLLYMIFDSVRRVIEHEMGQGHDVERTRGKLGTTCYQIFQGFKDETMLPLRGPALHGVRLMSLAVERWRKADREADADKLQADMGRVVAQCAVHEEAIEQQKVRLAQHLLHDLPDTSAVTPLPAPPSPRLPSSPSSPEWPLPLPPVADLLARTPSLDRQRELRKKGQSLFNKATSARPAKSLAVQMGPKQAQALRKSVDMLKEAIECFKQAGGDLTRLAQVLHFMGEHVRLVTLNSHASMAYFTQALSLLDDPVACPGDREGLVKELALISRAQLATCLYSLGRHAEAEALALHIVHAYPTPQGMLGLGIPPREILDSHLSALRKLTSVALLRRDYPRVKQHCRAGIALVKATGRDGCGNGSMAQNLVHFLSVMGSVAEAQQRHTIAVGMDSQCIQVLMRYHARPECGGVMMCMVPALRRMRQLYFQRAQKGKEGSMAAAVKFMDMAYMTFQASAQFRGHEQREGNLQLVEALRVLVEIRRYQNNRKDANKLEAELDKVVSLYEAMDQALLQDIRREVALQPEAALVRKRKASKKAKKRRNKAARQKAAAEDQGAPTSSVEEPNRPATPDATLLLPAPPQASPPQPPQAEAEGEGKEEEGEKEGGEEEREGEECAVCLLDLAELGGPGPTLVCGHLYHSSCLELWLGRCVSLGQHATCPMCRGPVLLA